MLNYFEPFDILKTGCLGGLNYIGILNVYSTLAHLNHRKETMKKLLNLETERLNVFAQYPSVRISVGKKNLPHLNGDYTQFSGIGLEASYMTASVRRTVGAVYYWEKVSTGRTSCATAGIHYADFTS